jgi:hypothetical protein
MWSDSGLRWTAADRAHTITIFLIVDGYMMRRHFSLLSTIFIFILFPKNILNSRWRKPDLRGLIQKTELILRSPEKWTSFNINIQKWLILQLPTCRNSFSQLLRLSPHFLIPTPLQIPYSMSFHYHKNSMAQCMESKSAMCVLEMKGIRQV